MVRSDRVGSGAPSASAATYGTVTCCGAVEMLDDVKGDHSEAGSELPSAESSSPVSVASAPSATMFTPRLHSRRSVTTPRSRISATMSACAGPASNSSRPLAGTGTRYDSSRSVQPKVSPPSPDTPSCVSSTSMCTRSPFPHWTKTKTSATRSFPKSSTTGLMLAANEFTVTVLIRFVVVPSPSWPELLSPQHDGTPFAPSAQVCDPPSPAATATAKVRLLTCTGALLDEVFPVPSWPDALLPQQRAVPSERTAQL